MPFYIEQYEDEFETGLPMGYSVIEVEKEKAPKGVKILNEKQLEKAVKSIESDNEKLIEALANDKPISIKDKYTLKELKKLATENKIKGRGKLKTEDELIKALIDVGVKL